MPLIYIETYGCSNNQAESEMIKGLLSSSGGSFTNNLEIAELVIINTCVVKSKTISKIEYRIQELYKKFGKKLIITGCMPETSLKQIEKLAPKSSILGTHNIKKIVSLITNILNNKRTVITGKADIIKCSLPKLREEKLISIIPISSGCDGQCAYCLTKLAKGKLFSYPKDEIIKSIESDLQNGAKEIWLTSQDCASYGLDKNKNELINLLKSILALKHKFKLRLGMMNPNNVIPILKELIEIYKNKKMYKFIHIPIQSASNEIITHMNRYYKIEQVENIIKEFKKEFPNITIATDIIVGYPIENNEDHKANLNFIQNIKPDVLNLSKFSSHKGTAAGRLKILEGKIIAKRASELMQAHRKTAEENKQHYKNKVINVFINKKISENLYEARDENYTIVLLKADKTLLGKEVQVTIKQVGVHHLIGDII